MRVLIFLLLTAAVILLQVFLSRGSRRWPGLVLPILCFLFSFVFPLNMVAPAAWWQVTAVFFLGNIPTVILLAVYGVCRRRKDTQLRKMEIQDL